MIDVWTKIYSIQDNPSSTCVFITIDSLRNECLFIGCPVTGHEMVVSKDEIDGLIDALKILKGTL